MITLRLDAETKSGTDLKKHGLDRYVHDPEFEILMLAWRVDAEAVQLWVPDRGPMPERLHRLLKDPAVRKAAWNAQFERTVIRVGCGIVTEPKEWRCTMVRAMLLGLPGELDLCGKVLRLSDKVQKDAEGKRLIKLFTVPHNPTKAHPYRWYTAETHKEDWRLFCAYCIKDVVSEGYIDSLLQKYPIPEIEWDIYALDQKINDRGVPIDVPFIRNAIAMFERRKAEIKKEMRDLTRLSNPNSTGQLLPWVKERGYPFGNLTKDRVKKALADFKDTMTDEAVAVLKLRLVAAKTSVTKYSAMLKCVGDDGRLRFMFQMSGAGRTARWAGRKVQLHNLARPFKEFEKWLPEIRHLVAANDYEGIKQLFGDPILVLSTMVRCAIAAKPGKELRVADKSAIETRLTGYCTGCESLNEVFRQNRCPYKTFAAQVYKKPYDEITKEERTLNKPAVLGCFSAYTRVLTSSGVKPIVDVRDDDLVFDGVEWVPHTGLTYRGVRKTIDLLGVSVTADHEILVREGEWQTAGKIVSDARSLSQALNLACGLCSNSEKLKKNGTIYAGAPDATSKKSYTDRILNSEKPLGVIHALSEFAKKLVSRFIINFLPSPVESSTLWPIGIMPFAVGVRPTDTPDTRVAESKFVFSMSTILFGTAYPYPGVGIYEIRSTEKITTGTTRPEIYDSSRAGSTTGIKRRTAGSRIKGNECPQWFFTKNTHLNTGMSARFAEKSEQGYPQRQSLRIRQDVEEHTYDLTNCGPRNRFTILTDAGPLIVHNCGYMLSGGKEVGTYPDTEKTGLWAYAESMGIKLDKGQCQHQVTIYREAYPEVVQSWEVLTEAAMRAINERVPVEAGLVTFDVQPPFLRMKMPSGRYVYYLRPRIGEHKIVTAKARPAFTETKPDGRVVHHPATPEEFFMKRGISYEGRNKVGAWTRVNTHGGKQLENCLSADSVVLTPSGGKRIVDVGVNDLVWDGVQWVRHAGLAFRGCRKTIDFGGVWITEEHLVDIDVQWVEAGKTTYEEAASSFSRHYRAPCRIFDRRPVSRVKRKKIALASSMRLRARDRYASIRTEEGKAKVLRVPTVSFDRFGGYQTRHVGAPSIRSLAVYAGSMPESKTSGVQELWRPGNNCLPGVEKLFRTILGRHGTNLQTGAGVGPRVQRLRLRWDKLPLGYVPNQQQKQTVQSSHRYTNWANASLEGGRDYRHRDNNAPLPGLEFLPDGKPVRPTGRIEPVYDLKNCGPNNRFTIVGPDGRMVLVHNCIQAFARDDLAISMLRADAEDFCIVLHVHDEIGCEEDITDQVHTVERLIEIESEPPPFAPDLLLGAAGYVSPFFKKD